MVIYVAEWRLYRFDGEYFCHNMISWSEIAFKNIKPKENGRDYGSQIKLMFFEGLGTLVWSWVWNWLFVLSRQKDWWRCFSDNTIPRLYRDSMQPFATSWSMFPLATSAGTIFKFIFYGIRLCEGQVNTPVIPTSCLGYALRSSVVQVGRLWKCKRKLSQHDITNYIAKRHELAC